MLLNSVKTQIDSWTAETLGIKYVLSSKYCLKIKPQHALVQERPHLPHESTSLKKVSH